MVVKSKDSRQACIVVGVGAVCLSALVGCTGLVSGSNGGSSVGNDGTAASGNSTGNGTAGTAPIGPDGKPIPTGTGGGSMAGAGGASSVQPIDPGSSLIHRLNTPEYNNTVADVLGTTLQPADGLWAAEETAGFNNQAAVQLVDDKQYQRYFDAANAVAANVFANAALKAKIVTCATTDDAACVNGIINATGLKLFRRPVTADELTTYHKVYTDARALGLAHEPSLQNVLAALLASAQFVYRMEFDAAPTSTTVHDLSGYELASRLSYFLWQTAPDDALMKVAGDNSLTQTAVLTAQIDRAAADPKFERFTQSFIGQWLGVRKVGAHAVTATVFPSWTPALGAAMANEVYSFFDEFAKGNLPWTDFVNADVNFVNADLAKLYGMPAPASGTQRVVNTTDNRFGFFGMGAFLALSSYEYRTAPTLRGRWILLNLLCTPPQEPPPGIPKLDAAADDAAAQQNVRQRLEAHRASPICASCHATLDPYGLALENFDAIGAYRSAYPNGSVIDASTVTADGAMFTGLKGLAAQVAKQPSMLSCVEKQLFTYSLGRAPGDTDQPYLSLVQQAWTADTPTLPRLIKGLVLADTFRKRHGGL
jgi:hypothetical protein